ncbi:MAG: hypothetical protein QOH00_3905 [Gaiellales bacterium]|nr:hypothetical protein [Gaiellales bacterium]
MSSEPILICYDGSQSAEHSFHAAAALLAGRTAIVADIGPVLTGFEAYAAVTPGINIALLEQENLNGAMERAEQGAELTRRAGFDVEARAELSAPTPGRDCRSRQRDRSRGHRHRLPRPDGCTGEPGRERLASRRRALEASSPDRHTSRRASLRRSRTRSS